MSKEPPRTYREFVATYPRLGEAWDVAREAENDGPLDEKTRRLVKLGVAAGAMRRGAVTSAARKARAAGATDGEVEQVVALAATTLGFPSAVAVFDWIRQR
jgi:alkylhydroperoxidase/carboxymuconolactone decarboxylase family protein YurZ